MLIIGWDWNGRLDYSYRKMKMKCIRYGKVRIDFVIVNVMGNVMELLKG